MTDFFIPLDSEVVLELARKLADAAKPSNQMSDVEWAEFLCLEASLKLEGLKAGVLYARLCAAGRKLDAAPVPTVGRQSA